NRSRFETKVQGGRKTYAIEEVKYASHRNRRMFKSRIGSTSRNRNTAIAEPRPKSLIPPNDVRHMASAITFASSCTDCGATAKTTSKTFKTLISIVMKTTVKTGASSGTVTRRKTCHSDAPSVRAASSVSRGIAARPAAITTIANPAQTQMYAMISAGVISFGPSHETPANGGRKFDAPIAAW